MKIAIAGASGFVGQSLTEALLRDGHEVIALTRGGKTPLPDLAPELAARLTVRSCDLFSLLDAELGLEGAQLACYLVHSMLPSARLTQGDFSAFDLIAADNFARAAKLHGVSQIVYLGGLIPEGPEALSRHLESRHEVERALAAHGTPLTTLRAGLVIGAGGSTMLLLLRLVRRLPAMLLPSWTATRTQPVALEDAVFLLRHCLGRQSCFGQTYDIGGPEVMTYRQMMQAAAEVLGVKRRLLPMPFFSTRLSRLWVSVVTGAPRALVAPLIESLRHPMVCRDRRLQDEVGRPGLPFREALRRAIRDLPAGAAAPRAYRKPPPSLTAPNEVRSVQRLPLPPGRDADWVSREYLRWLPRWMRPLVRVSVRDGLFCEFYLGPLRSPVLLLELSPERSSPDRTLFYIRGGLLVDGSQGSRARLEFREVLDRQEVLAAIHEFRPRLPWLIYTATQALGHLWVMRGFGRHLRALKAAGTD